MTVQVELEKVVSQEAYCEWRGITKGAAAQERYKGTGPKFVKAGKSVLYRVSDVNDWLDQQTRERT
ncbi:helix-turn-helix transcriptional regulator [Glutamicibacter arilaitensis]|uniref:helix-turn-helix transcriptional regulator n=1 Tax=Glutamicibacter TaxID=1742989 RepID=UPI003F901628